MKSKLEVQYYSYFGWKGSKQFPADKLNRAIQCCEQLRKQVGTKSKTRVVDLESGQRVYPVQKDKFGNPIQ